MKTRRGISKIYKMGHELGFGRQGRWKGGAVIDATREQRILAHTARVQADLAKPENREPAPGEIRLLKVSPNVAKRRATARRKAAMEAA